MALEQFTLNYCNNVLCTELPMYVCFLNNGMSYLLIYYDLHSLVIYASKLCIVRYALMLCSLFL